MPTYIVLGRLTPKAKQNSVEARKARDKNWSDYEKLGLKIRAYSTLGRFDSVLILDAPTEELLMKFLMAAGATGNIETETLRAIPVEEADRFRSG